MDKLTPDLRYERDLDNEMVDEALASENIKDEFERLKPIYKEWIEDYCNVTFEDGKIPAIVSMALDELVKTDPKRYNMQSEKLSDMSITYASGGAGGNSPLGVPNYILAWLEPYRRINLVSDKKKKPYVRD